MIPPYKLNNNMQRQNEQDDYIFINFEYLGL